MSSRAHTEQPIFMPIKHPQFVNGEIYHIVIRGIAGQKTFLEEKDYLRYLFSLYKFNDKKIIFSAFRDTNITWEAIPSSLVKPEKSRDLLVEILGFCLMPNHIHLLVHQVADNGISLFLQKMGGYSSYFNKKYQRFGGLFQRPFKAIHIETEDQLLIVITYIHLNPIDLIEQNWKIKGISNPQKVMEFLESYLWSSYPHYLGKDYNPPTTSSHSSLRSARAPNFSWLINSSFLKKILEKPGDFRNFVKARIFHKTKLKSFLEKAQNFSLG